MSVDPRKLEVLSTWYSVFCVLVDAYAEGEFTTQAFVEKSFQLRRELADAMPDVEADFRRKRN